MSELNILLLRRRKIHCGGKQTEVQVIACRLLELLQVLGKTNSAAKTVTNSDEVEPAALENKSLDEERSDKFEPACKLACESDSGEDDNCNDAEYLHLSLTETTDKSINTLEQETFSSTLPVSSFGVATLSSAVFLVILFWFSHTGTLV